MITIKDVQYEFVTIGGLNPDLRAHLVQNVALIRNPRTRAACRRGPIRIEGWFLAMNAEPVCKRCLKALEIDL